MLLSLTVSLAGAITSRATETSGAVLLTMSIVIVALLAVISRLTQGSLIARPGRRRRQRGGRRRPEPAGPRRGPNSSVRERLTRLPVRPSGAEDQEVVAQGLLEVTVEPFEAVILLVPHQDGLVGDVDQPCVAAGHGLAEGIAVRR